MHSLPNTALKSNKPSRLLITSEGFPPLLDASAVLVNNIFSKYKGEMFAIAGTNFTKKDITFKAPCKTWYIRYPRNRFMESFMRRFHHYLLPIYYFYLWFKIRQIKPSVIFANYPHEVLFVASYKAAKKLKIPLFIYMHDLWEENMVRPNAKKFAARWEKEIFENAELIICCTSAQQDFYRQKYNLESELILHPIPDEELDNQITTTIPGNGKITILYSGSLSPHMNLDAFVQMSKALDLLGEEYELIWYPVNHLPESLLHNNGITSKKIKIKYIPREELNNALHNADLLFAPLSHKNCSEEEVRTVFSNKLLGYLNAGKPILIFGPENCHHVTIARKGNWGYIIDKDDPKVLADSIQYLINNPALGKELVKNAYLEAESRRASVFANKILTWVNLTTNKN